MTERHPGAIPPGRRRLALLVTLGVGLAVLAGGLIVNAAAGSPIRWFYLVVIVVFAMMAIAAYLWIRLSD